MDGSNGGLTFAESLACRQQLIGPPQAIASDILLKRVGPSSWLKLERNLENNAPENEQIEQIEVQEDN